MKQDDKLDFMQMLSAMRVIDDDDRIRAFKECIEAQYNIVSRKVAEYHKDGELIIKMKFQYDKKCKNGVNVSADVSRKIPKGTANNQFYFDERTGGIYYDDPNQLKMFTGSNIHPISGKDAAGQNES